MSDPRNSWSFNPFAPGEPPRDAALGALLRRSVGDADASAVDWDALATRISRALPSRATGAWWSYADRWSRRMLPIALAAGLAGAVALWRAEESAAAPVPTVDVVADVVQGGATADAARDYARTVTADVTLAAFGEP